MRHVWTKEEQIRGLEKALRSRRTPSWLKPNMRRYLKKLKKKLEREKREKRKRRLLSEGKASTNSPSA
jgi:hypothetical protein